MSRVQKVFVRRSEEQITPICAREAAIFLRPLICFCQPFPYKMQKNTQGLDLEDEVREKSVRKEQGEKRDELFWEMKKSSHQEKV